MEHSVQEVKRILEVEEIREFIRMFLFNLIIQETARCQRHTEQSSSSCFKIFTVLGQMP